MTVDTRQVDVVAATLPRVNLLPPEIGERRRLRRLQYGMGAAVVAAVGVVAVLTVSAQGGVHDAQQRVETAQRQHAALQKQVTALSNVRQVYSQVAASEAMLSQAMGREVLWSHYLNDLSLTIPDKVWLTSLTVTEDVDGTAVPPAGSLTPSGIATVTAAGTAFTHDDVAAWLDSLAKEPGYTGAYFSNSTEAPIGGRKLVNFASTVTVTDAALSHCYTTPGPSACDTTSGATKR